MMQFSSAALLVILVVASLGVRVAQSVALDLRFTTNDKVTQTGMKIEMTQACVDDSDADNTTNTTFDDYNMTNETENTTLDEWENTTLDEWEKTTEEVGTATVDAEEVCGTAMSSLYEISSLTFAFGQNTASVWVCLTTNMYDTKACENGLLVKTTESQMIEFGGDSSTRVSYTTGTAVKFIISGGAVKAYLNGVEKKAKTMSEPATMLRAIIWFKSKNAFLTIIDMITATTSAATTDTSSHTTSNTTTVSGENTSNASSNSTYTEAEASGSGPHSCLLATAFLTAAALHSLSLYL